MTERLFGHGLEYGYVEPVAPQIRERELIVAYIKRYALRHKDMRRAALEVVAERIEQGDHLNGI